MRIFYLWNILFMWMNGMIYGFCIYVYVLCGFGILKYCISVYRALNNYILHHLLLRNPRICHVFLDSALAGLPAGHPTDRASTFPRFPIRLERYRWGAGWNLIMIPHLRPYLLPANLLPDSTLAIAPLASSLRPAVQWLRLKTWLRLRITRSG